MEIKIQLPVMIAVDDYHEFNSLRRILKQIVGDKKIIVEELGETQMYDTFGEKEGEPDVNNYYYYGVIYKGRFPSIKTMKGLSKDIKDIG